MNVPAPEKQLKELKSKLNFQLSLSDRIAIAITDVFGNLKFLAGFIAFLTFWMGWNLSQKNPGRAFDHFPFPALEMIVSVFGIMLTISVLISQRRQSRQEQINRQVEFEVNVRAEDEITKMLAMLHEIQQKLGIEKQDDQLEAMKENLNIHELHRKLGGEQPS